MEYERRCGVDVPVVGLGTAHMDTETAFDAVYTALEIGYRYVAVGRQYNNEAGVGGAIHLSPVDREELFLTVKLAPDHRSVASVISNMRQSLERLKVDAVDLVLCPWTNSLANLATMLDALEACVNRGLTRHVGVCNFSPRRLDRARELSNVPIFTDQVLFHPWWPQRKLLRYCQQHDILLTASSPLAHGMILEDEAVSELARAYGKSSAQVAIRWATQHQNVVTIPTASSRVHQEENLDVFDFLTSRAEHDRITSQSFLKTAHSYVEAIASEGISDRR